MSKLVIALVSVLMSSLLPLLAVHGADDYMAFVYAGCSQQHYDPGSQYEQDVESVITSLSNSAAYATYANFTSPSASTNVCGLYQCRSDLPTAICAACVRSAVSKLSTLCADAAGAAVQLRACFIRYGNDSFLGKQDTTLLLKKCGGGAAAPGDTEGSGMRDASLGALVAASAPTDGGGYRVGGAGYVQAMSQCVGDLGEKACTECVSSATAQLKAGCSYATAGEVYLGKCYARFWSNAEAAAGGGGGSSVTGGSYAPQVYNHEGESGKTLAIIIGLMAGVALVIIFLSFVRRAGNGKS